MEGENYTQWKRERVLNSKKYPLKYRIAAEAAQERGRDNTQPYQGLREKKWEDRTRSPKIVNQQH